MARSGPSALHLAKHFCRAQPALRVTFAKTEENFSTHLSSENLPAAWDLNAPAKQTLACGRENGLFDNLKPTQALPGWVCVWG
jgi:hypothetical protein